MADPQPCVVVTQPDGDVCGKPAVYSIRFSDGATATACQACALNLKQTALAHGAIVHAEKLRG